MIARKVRKPAPRPQEPARTLAAIEAVLGDDIALIERYADALFKIGAITHGSSSPYVLSNAAIMLAWTYQRMMKRKVKPWKRAWNWNPADRERIGAEIMAKALQSPELPFVVRIKVEMLVWDAFAIVGIADPKLERLYSISYEFDQFIVGCYEYVLSRSKEVDPYRHRRACSMIETCYYSAVALLSRQFDQLWAEIL